MMWWVATLLAQAGDPPPAPVDLNQALADAVASALLQMVGVGGSGTLAALVVGYGIKMWLERGERALKADTRSEIKAQGEALTAVAGSVAKVAEAVADIARIQERMLKELEEFRRESRSTLERIERLERAGG